MEKDAETETKESVQTMQRKYVKFNDSSDTTRKTLDPALSRIKLVDFGNGYFTTTLSYY